MEALANTYIIRARQKHFIQVNIFNNAPISRKALAMNSNSFNGSFAGKPFWYEQPNLRDFRILRGGHPILHHDTADNCRLSITKVEAKISQDDIPSVPIDSLKDNYVLVFDLN